MACGDRPMEVFNAKILHAKNSFRDLSCSTTVFKLARGVRINTASMTTACGTCPAIHKVKYQMHSLAHINLHVTLGNTGLLRNLIQRSQTTLEPQDLPPDEFRIVI